MDLWLSRNLVCPVDKTALLRVGNELRSVNGRVYQIVDEVPVLLPSDASPTIPLATASLARATMGSELADLRAPELFLESVGATDSEKTLIASLASQSESLVDPVVQGLVGATSGYSYRHLIGRMTNYPIPAIRLPNGDGRRLLDVGCGWGRWSISAAQRGYKVVGMDPSLGAVMAARRVCKQMGIDAHFIVGDARYIPFRDKMFDVVYSYSVVQHFAKSNAILAVREFGRILDHNGSALIQMASVFGLRSLYHQVKRRFREPRDFEVRYWTLPQIKSVFEQEIGPTEISVDCYFGLGLQESDREYLSPVGQSLVSISGSLRRMSKRASFLTYLADSVFVASSRLVAPR